MADESLIVKIGANIREFTRKMRDVSKTIMATEAIAKNARLGAFLTISPAIAPALAGITAAIASLGPMLAVAAGGAAGLGTAFGAAGAAAIGFGAVAVGNLASVFKASSDISKAQQEYSKALTDKERAKALDKEKQAWMGLDSEQKNALKSLQSFKSFWNGFYKSFQSPVLSIFSKSINALQSTLKMALPAIAEAARAIDGLMNSLNASLKTDDVKAFFDWLGTSAGPAITALGQSFGNIMRGIMNLMVAFGPLSGKMQNGLVGMTQAFADWTSGLSKSSKFQAFISYVETNGPKLLKILGNISSGLVGMFSAFAPMASNMMSGLVGLTAKFNTWGQSLGQTQGFKDFIAYVQTNGPKLLDLIGQLVTLGGNLLKAMAPLGSVTLDLVIGIAKLLNTLMGISPAFGYAIIAVIQMIGILKLLWPVIAFTQTEAGKAFLKMAADAIKSIATQIAAIVKMIAQWVLLGIQSMIQAARVAAAWVIAMGPIGWVIAAVIGLVALIVIYWDKIKAVTLKVFGYVWNWLKDQWNQMIDMFKQAAMFVAQVTIDAWNWIKDTSIAIWNGIKDFFVGIWDFFWKLHQQRVEQLKSILSAAWNWIKNVTSTVWNGIKGFFVGIWDGIKSGAEAFKDAFLGIWDAIKSGIKAVINPIIGFMNGILTGIENVINGIASAINSIPSFTVPDWVPDIGGKSFGLPHIGSISLPRIPALSVGTNYVARDGLAYLHQGEAVVPKRYNPAANGNSDLANRPIIIQTVLNGRIIAEETYKDISDLQERDSRRVLRAYGMGV